jgi:membrane protein DedA with SNARE-associated domain
VQSLVQSLQSLNPFWIYVSLFSIAFIENIFPPSPSDIIIVFGGSLIGLGRIDFIPALLISTAGSTLGFMAMYKVGDWFGLSIIERRRIKFLPIDNVHKIEQWFRKYGYWIIVINRFLSGTRAVISFVAGLAELNLLWTTVLCFVSALVWNAILISFGELLGQNWQLIGLYLSSYSQIVTIVVIFITVVWIGLWLYKRSRNNV